MKKYLNFESLKQDENARGQKRVYKNDRALLKFIELLKEAKVAKS